MIQDLTRDEAITLVRRYVSKENNVKHMIAVGAAMSAVASRMGQDPARWELVGILHDIDFEICTGIEDHTLKAREMLEGKIDQELIEAIMAHNHEHTGVLPDTQLKKGLIACDAASGLVTACALVIPSKKLADVHPESLVKKFGSKDFAKGVSRERILVCEQIGIGRDEFLALCLDGMRAKATELGL
ncbi:MAG: HDIG domain-containing metalloprotein [Methanomassiliicoccales archaeon]|jgi:putative nucleotidyltransferase with HDIG domain